eukprot:UC4_evm1s845
MFLTSIGADPSETSVPLNNQISPPLPSPFMLAVKRGHIAVVEELCSNFLPKLDGEAALIEACRRGHDAITMYLINIKCQNFISDDGRFIALFELCQAGKHELIAELREVCTLHAKKSHPELGFSLLFGACLSGRDETVRLLIDMGLDVDVGDGEGNTPLNIASLKGHNTIIRNLLKGGANISRCNSLGESSLHLACKMGRADAVSILLNEKECLDMINTQTSQGWTPLHFGVASGCTAVVEALMRSGANACVANNDGHTPIVIAREHQYYHVVSLMVNFMQEHSISFRLAAKNGDLEAIKALMQEKKDSIDVNEADQDGKTALFLASRKGHFDVILYLLNSCGASHTIKDRYDWSPLHAACALPSDSDGLKIVNRLLQAGANPCLLGKRGESTLHIAARVGNTDIVKHLLSKTTVSVNSLDFGFGFSPLQVAAKNGHVGTCSILLAFSSANVDQKDKMGRTALMLASSNGALDAVKVLTGLGVADCSLRDNCGNDAIAHAKVRGHVNVAKFLLSCINREAVNTATCDDNPVEVSTTGIHVDSSESQNCEDLDNKPAFKAVAEDDLSSLKRLLCRDPLILQTVNDDGQTLLHKACIHSSAKVANYLIKLKKLNCNALDRYGYSALHYSCTAENFTENLRTIIESLVFEGCAKLDVREMIEGFSPLHLACRNGNDYLVKLLLSLNGCKPDLPDKYERRTALHIACSHGHEKIVRLLCQQSFSAISKLDSRGWSPLVSACFGGHFGVASFLLLECGVDLNITSNGISVLDIAKKKGEKKIVSLLLSCGARRTISHVSPTR